jgi:hypothetical protein
MSYLARTFVIWDRHLELFYQRWLAAFGKFQRLVVSAPEIYSDFNATV